MLRGLPDHAKRLAEWADKNGWTGCVRKYQVEWINPYNNIRRTYGL